VRTYHRLHCHVRKSKYRLLAQPVAFFENLFEAFSPGDRFTILFAELEGVPVAGSLFLEWGDALYYKFNASVEQWMRPNDLLIWEGTKLGRRRGLACLDFGLSDPAQPGLVRFKRKFATDEREISMLRWAPACHLDRRGEQVRLAFSRMTHLLTEPTVPDEITKAAGDELYRFFC